MTQDSSPSDRAVMCCCPRTVASGARRVRADTVDLDARNAVWSKTLGRGPRRRHPFKHDAGETWFIQHFEPEAQEPLLDVLFLNPNQGFAVGAYGRFMTTKMAGSTGNQAGY